MSISTHVLDLVTGKPGDDIEVKLEYQTNSGWSKLASGRTNSDGRIVDLSASKGALHAGVYQLTFDTKPYFKRTERAGFYPHISIAFEVIDERAHYHVPILLGPYGYTTYRGS